MKILTDCGFRYFDGFIDKGERSDLICIYFSNGEEIKCTPCHEFLMTDGIYLPAEFLEPGNILYSGITIEDIVYIDECENVYDALNVEGTFSYWNNGVISHNCLVMDEFAFVQNAEAFYTSTYPVITSGSSTKVIITSTPNGVGNMFYKLWQGAIQKANEFKSFRINWWDIPGKDEKWKADTIANTSELQFRQEFSCLGGDTLITVLDTITNKEMQITLSEMYSLL